MSNLFDYNLDRKNRGFFRPKNWHIIPLTFFIGLLYLGIDHYYYQKQRDLAFELTKNAVKLTRKIVSQFGPINVKENKLYAGDSLLNKTSYIVDSVYSITGFHSTLFHDDVRIANTDRTYDSTSRVIGTKSNEEIANRVLRGGKSFVGITRTLGKRNIIVYEPLRNQEGVIVGMVSCFKNADYLIADLNTFRIYLASALAVLYIFIVTLILLATRWSKLIDNQRFVLDEKSKNLHGVTEELKGTYEHLRASEEKFKDFFENSYDLIHSVDLEGNFLFVNTSWTKTLGYQYHEILKITLDDIIHPDFKAQYDKLQQSAINGDDVLGADMVFLTKERDAILLNGNIHCEFNDGEPIAIRGVFRNDTNRKLSQKRLEESERQYRFLVESANDLIFRTDYKGNFTYANGIVKDVTGYSVDELVGMNYLDLVKEEYKQTVVDYYSNQFANRLETTYFEFQIRKKNGQYIWVGQNVKTLFKNEDKDWIEGYQIVSRDITDRKKKEEQINLQNKQLEEQNRSIKESIRYAKRIQDSILPNENQLTDLFPESFVYYQPKDIVSGDFYWIAKRDDKLFLAVADCTGHGVPAAFMSIIGSNLLNIAINRKHLSDPIDILKEISSGFRRVLKRPMDDIEIQDGMDISICCINDKSRKAEFAGAFNDLYMVRNKKLIKYRGTRISVGADEQHYKQFSFEKHNFELKENDTIYLFSDGFADQFGGSAGRKLGYERFREILLKIHEEDMAVQRRLLEEAMVEWRGGEEQIDDICVLGVRF